MWAYRIKKWLARLLFVAALILVILASARYDPDVNNWANWIFATSPVLALFVFYSTFKPTKPPPPADGLRTDQGGTMLGTSEWQEEVRANEFTIRTAMLSCHSIEYSVIEIVRGDQDYLRAYWDRGGWTIRIGKIGERNLDMVMRDDRGGDFDPVKFSWFKVMFGKSLDGDRFANSDTELMLNAFAKGDALPDFTAQRTIARD